MAAIDYWLARGTPVSSPADLAVIHQVRAAIEMVADLGPRVPTDRILMAIGPPPAPHLTKLGGVPYRPAAAPWPRRDNGRPYTFVGQFSFVDSYDLLAPPLPGDLLLLFAASPDAWLDSDSPDGVYMEWQPREIAEPMRAEQAPPPAFRVPELHGHLLRDHEFPKSQRLFQQSGFLEWWYFIRTQSCRIGGCTYFPAQDPRACGLIDPGAEFLCSLSSVLPATFPVLSGYPLVSDAPIDLPVSEIERYAFLIGDMGCISIFREPNGDMVWQAFG